MSGILAAVRRHLPGAHRRRVERIFLHGWHAGYHDAAGGDCLEWPCEVWEQINQRANNR